MFPAVLVNIFFAKVTVKSEFFSDKFKLGLSLEQTLECQYKKPEKKENFVSLNEI